MQVTADNLWVPAGRVDLVTGDLIAASTDSARLYALVVVDDSDQQAALVLAYRGTDPEMDKARLPIGRSVNDLSHLLRFTGVTTVRAVRDPNAPLQDAIPGAPSAIRHGDLLIVGEDKVPWVFIENRVDADRVFHFYVNLSTGQIAMKPPGGAAVHDIWELVVNSDAGPGPVLARIDTRQTGEAS